MSRDLGMWSWGSRIVQPALGYSLKPDSRMARREIMHAPFQRRRATGSVSALPVLISTWASHAIAYAIDPDLAMVLPPVQLPVYVPNEEEKKDPAKYAKNVRKLMVSPKPGCPCLPGLASWRPRKGFAVPYSWTHDLSRLSVGDYAASVPLEDLMNLVEKCSATALSNT